MRARKAIPDLPTTRREDIRRLVTNLESDPIPYGGYDIAKLKGAEDAYARACGKPYSEDSTDAKSLLAKIRELLT